MSNEKQNEFERKVKEFWSLPDVQRQLKEGNSLFLTWERGSVVFKQLLGDVHVENKAENTELDISVSGVKISPLGKDYEMVVDIGSISGVLRGKSLPVPDNSIRLKAKAVNRDVGVGIKIREASLGGQNMLAGVAVSILKGAVGMAGYDVDSIITNSVVGASDEKMQADLAGFLEGGVGKKVKKPRIKLEEMGVRVKWELDEVKKESRMEEGGEVGQLEKWEVKEGDKEKLKGLIGRLNGAPGMFTGETWKEGRMQEQRWKDLETMLELGIFNKIKSDVENMQVKSSDTGKYGDVEQAVKYVEMVFGEYDSKDWGDFNGREKLKAALVRVAITMMDHKLGGKSPSFDERNLLDLATGEFLKTGKISVVNSKKEEGRMEGQGNMVQPEEFFKPEGRKLFGEHFGSKSVVAHLDEFLATGGDDFKPALKMWDRIMKVANGKSGYEIAGTVAELVKDKKLWEKSVDEIKRILLQNLDQMGIRGSHVDHYVVTVLITLEAETKEKADKKLVKKAKKALLPGHEVSVVG